MEITPQEAYEKLITENQTSFEEVQPRLRTT